MRFNRYHPTLGNFPRAHSVRPAKPPMMTKKVMIPLTFRDFLILRAALIGVATVVVGLLIKFVI